MVLLTTDEGQKLTVYMGAQAQADEEAANAWGDWAGALGTSGSGISDYGAGGGGDYSLGFGTSAFTGYEPNTVEFGPAPFWNEATQRTEDPGHPGYYWGGDSVGWINDAQAQPLTNAWGDVGGALGVTPDTGYDNGAWNVPEDPWLQNARLGEQPWRQYDLGFGGSPLTDQGIEWSAPEEEGGGGFLGKVGGGLKSGLEWLNNPLGVDTSERRDNVLTRGLATAGREVGEGADWYTKNILNPIAETGAELTPGALTAARYGAAGLLGPVGLASTLGGDYLASKVPGMDWISPGSQGEKGLAGVRDVGSALSESGGDPLEFRDIQNERFAERPAWQQFASQAVFDPANAIPFGKVGAARRGLARAGKAAFGDVPVGTALASEAGGAVLPRGLGARLSDAQFHNPKAITTEFPTGIGGRTGNAVDDILGLREVTPGLTPMQRFANTLSELTGQRIGPKVLNDPQVTPIMTERARVYRVAESQSSRIAEQAKVVERTFAKTDVLTPQLEARIRKLGEEFESYRELGNTLGRDIGSRADVVAGGIKVGDSIVGMDIRDVAAKMGVYLPRGNPVEDGLQDIVKVGTGAGRRGAKTGSEKGAVYASVAEGVANGEVYPSLTESVKHATSGLGKAIADQDAANKFIATGLGETAAERVPAALRSEHDAAKSIVKRLEGRLATAEKRAGIATGKGQTLATTFEKQVTGATQSIDEALAEVSTMNNVIRRAQTRIVELRQKGGQWATEASNYQDMLDDASKRLDDVQPKWTAAVEKSRATPRGQGTIGLTPLQGHTFPEAFSSAANKILAAEAPLSGRGSGPIKVVEALNALLRGINASVDASFMGIQGLLVAGKDPTSYAKAFAVATEAFANPRVWGRFAESFDQTAAQSASKLTMKDVARYVTLHGSDTEFAIHTLANGGKINPIRGSNRAFGAFGDTARPLMFRSAADARVAMGKPMTEEWLAALGKSVDRATGITARRFGGAWGDVMLFAPRFFMSQLEVVGKALFDGTIEGAFARDALAKTIGEGVLITVAANHALGNETDFDPGSSNFMRIRVKGQDVSVFGPWDSLIRGVTSSAGIGPYEPDPTYLLRTKASPVIGIAWDLLSGKDFQGNPTRDSLGTLGEYLARRAAPFSLSDVGEKPLGTTAIGTTGLKASSVTAYEQRDEQAQAKFGRPWRELSPQQQNALKAEEGSSAATYKSTQPDAVASAERRAADRVALVTTQQEVDAQYARPGSTLPKTPDDGEKWRDAYHTTIAQQDALFKKEDRDFPYTGDPSKDPTRQALAERSALIETNKAGHEINWDAIDAWAATNPEKQSLIDAYYADPNKPNTDLTPMVTAYKAASKEIGDSGYFDIYDTSWEQVRKFMPTARDYATYDEWKVAQVETYAAQFVKAGVSAEKAQTDAETALGKTAEQKLMDDLNKRSRAQWMLENPQAAVDAWRWGYFSPTKDQKVYLDWLLGQGKVE